MTEKPLTIKNQVSEYLTGKDWVGGLILERDIGELTDRKFSNISRRLREMENEGRLERRITTDPKHFVEYRLKEQEIPTITQPRAQRLFQLSAYLNL